VKGHFRLLITSVVLLEYLEPISGGERNATSRNCLVRQGTRIRIQVFGGALPEEARRWFDHEFVLECDVATPTGKTSRRDRLSVAKYAGEGRFQVNVPGLTNLRNTAACSGASSFALTLSITASAINEQGVRQGKRQ
jgi:hypothetical protein